MSHFDDWRPPQDDWGDKSAASNYSFDTEATDDFGFPIQDRKSPGDRLRTLPLWARIGAPVALGVVLVFITIQAGLPTKIRSWGFFREDISAAAACLNSYQVLAAASTGTVNQSSMNRAVDFATRLKGQKSPNEFVNSAMWAVSDATISLDRALADADFRITFADIAAGDLEGMGFTPELNEAAIELSAATSQVNDACGDIDVASDLSDLYVQESAPQLPDSSAPEESAQALPNVNSSPSEAPGGGREDAETEFDEFVDDAGPAGTGPPLSEENLIALAKQATFYVECWTGGDEVATGTAFLADLSNVGVSGGETARIITNHHVIEACVSRGEISLQDGNGQWFEANIVDTDEFHDIAYLNSNAGDGVQALTVDQGFSIGEEVILSGHPDGIDTAVTFGRVTVFDQDEYLIFSDALAGPGSSGGPMINMTGEVVGIVTYILEVTRGMSIASPIDAVCISLEDC